MHKYIFSLLSGFSYDGIALWKLFVISVEKKRCHNSLSILSIAFWRDRQRAAVQQKPQLTYRRIFVLLVSSMKIRLTLTPCGTTSQRLSINVRAFHPFDKVTYFWSGIPLAHFKEAGSSDSTPSATWMETY